MSNLTARAFALFDEYVEMRDADRATALAKLKQVDPELHDELAALLSADAAPFALSSAPYDMLGGAISATSPVLPPQVSASADSRIGTRLGPWLIDSIIGTGGMGTVYLAHRADGEYEQTVALKCLRAELYSPQLEAAFRRERNTLAQLEHPNVARLIDGGIDGSGHPWFAMQKVEGSPIDRWCDQYRLSVRERIQLLSEACSAVAYVHGQGVLHQDIKPSNLLVGDDGRPILLDFGLTELLSQERTRYRPRIAASGGYTAPEILRDGTVDVSGDIYAVGVILYRLLCADWPVPHDPAHATKPLVMGTAPQAPRRPSDLALHATEHTAHTRGHESARQLSRKLAGDLDSIALQCVATDPRVRYGAISELRIDLLNWLHRRPVCARNGGPAYRIRRFMQRNMLTTVLALTVILSLGSMTGFFLWRAQQAHQEEALNLAISQLFERVPDGAVLPEWGSMPINLPSALVNSERALRKSRLQDSPRAMSRALLTLARGYIAIGDHAYALKLAKEAIHTSHDDAQEQAWAQATLASLYYSQANYAKAEQSARAGIDELGRPVTVGKRNILALLQTQVARARWQMADHETAKGILDATIKNVDSSENHYPEGLRSELLALRSEWNNQLQNHVEGQADAERAITLAVSSSLSTASAQEQLAAALRETRSTAIGLKTANENLLRQQRHYGSEHPETGLAWIILAEMQQTNGQAKNAMQSANQAIRILRPALGDRHPNIARALRVIALALASSGNGESAINNARNALSIMEGSYGSRHYQTILTRQILAVSLGYLAQSTGQSAPLEEAITQYERLLRDGESLNLPMSKQWLAYGIRLTNSGRTVQARKALQRALSQFGPGNEDLAFETRRNLAVIALKERNYGEARSLLEASASELRNDKRQSHYRHSALSDTLLELSQLELEQDRPEAAREHLKEALEINNVVYGTSDPQTKAIQLALDALEGEQ